MKKKRTYFIDHTIQRKYLRVVLFAMLGPTLVVGGCLYYLIWETVAYELAIPELISRTLFPAYHRVNHLLLIGLPLVFVVILFFAARLAHRIAGPIYRIEQELESMVETRNFTKAIQIRPKDELHPLVKKINQAIRAAQEKR